MAKKVGTLIKEARTKAGLTQAELARKVTGASASDIGKAERGEKELTTAQLKEIAKATGVTQKSLLEAAKGASSSSSGTSVKVTATEKKLLEAYRAATSEQKKNAMKILKGEEPESSDSLVNNLITNAIDMLTGTKRDMEE